MPSKQEDRGRAGVGCGVWVWGVGVGDGAPAELLPRMPKPTARACRDGPYALVFKTIDCSFYSSLKAKIVPYRTLGSFVIHFPIGPFNKAFLKEAFPLRQHGHSRCRTDPFVRPDPDSRLNWL